MQPSSAVRPTGAVNDAAPRLLLTPNEAADALGISRALLFQMLARGDIFSLKVGRLRRVPVEALRRYVAQRMEEEGWQG